MLIVQRRLSQGQPLSEAGFKAGLFNYFQKTLIKTGETSGKLTGAYDHLAGYYAVLSKRMKKIKSRLLVPALILILALFLQPLPDLIASHIGGFEYLMLSLGKFIVIAIGTLLLVKIPLIVRALGAGKYWDRLQLRIPGISNWLIKRELNRFFTIFGILLDSGIPAANALPEAVLTIRNSSLKEQFRPALAIANSGISVSSILAKGPLIPPDLLQTINSSELSGRLPSGILHFCRMEAQTIDLQDDALAEWLPRLVYCLVVIWLGYSLVNTRITSVLPAFV